MAVAIPSGFNSQIGQEQFLKLLAAQLAHQNPLEPTSQEDFLGQLAQFSTLSGIEQLNSNFADLVKLQSLTEGASLVGKNVKYFSNVSKADEMGVVQAASVVQGSLVLTINGEQVPLGDISSVMSSMPEA
ncbi:flagellar hook assembly protein FlgD [Planctomicrobium sp. SH661]|uniref:flagellar hook assembly protein FlgD n=1 Tax=Planctomicrobium sp. SH661 TaxID=3448124 RepID=UPI003F5CA68C